MLRPETVPVLSAGQMKGEGSDDIDMAVTIPVTATSRQYGANDATECLIISFKDLTYTVKHRKTKKDLDILSGVNGFFKPGHMSALMGPSGSGKTTLLDVLAGRKTVGTIKGDIQFGSDKPTKAFLKRYTGYVEQFDTLLETLTVEEMFMYTAELKLPETMPIEEKKARVEDMIAQLRLTKCRDTRIGSSLARGISGGQAKRVNIGISLVTDPTILFLDEPTSGLDSHTATEVMSVVKALATGNRTICATIHSPSAFTFRQFDTLMLLLDGRVAYFGPNGPEATSYFSKSAIADHAFDNNDNDAEWIMDITTSAALAGEGRKFTDAYEHSNLARQNLKELTQIKLDSKEDGDVEGGKKCALMRNGSGKGKRKDDGTSVGFFKAFSTLLKYRTFRNYRDGQWLGARIADKVMVVFILMTLYASRGDKTGPRGIQDMAGMLFLWVTLASFGASSYVPALVMERALFYRESADGLYSVFTYLVSKLFEELLLAFFATGALSIPVYFIVGIKGSFFILWLAYFITLSTGIAAAYFFASVSPTVDIANAALPAYMVSLLYFSGIVMNFDSIPAYWDWYSRIDFVRYGYTALLINHFEGRDLKLFGMPVLEFYSVSGQSAWANLGYQSIFFFFFATLAYTVLRYVRHDKR